MPVISRLYRRLKERRGFIVGRAADGSDVFMVGHADGSMYVCERGKEPCLEPQFAAVKDLALMQLTVSPKAAKHSPTARYELPTISTHLLSTTVSRQPRSPRALL